MKPYYNDVEIDRRSEFKLKEGSPSFLEYSSDIKGKVMRLESLDSKADPVLFDLYKTESSLPVIEKIDVWVICDNYGEEINIPYEDIEEVEYL